MSSASSIGGPAGDYAQSTASHVVKTAEVSIAESGISANSISASSHVALSVGAEAQLSPLAQVTSTLQQLQQSDPHKYRQVAQQIAESLQSDAQTAQAQGEQTQANRLNQIASDFATASQSGELPNLQDLAALAAL